MADNFKQMGGKVLSQEAVAPTDVDMHPLLTRIASEKPDVIYLPVFTAAAAQILRQSKETPGLEKTVLIGGASLLSADFIEAAGPAVVGFRIGYPDLSPDAMGKGYPEFVEEYKKAYGEAPISGYHANAYDAAMLAIKAIEKVAKTDKAGNLYIGKKALRDAVFAHQVRRHQRPDRLRRIRRVRAVPSLGAASSPRPIRRRSGSARTRRRSGRKCSLGQLRARAMAARPWPVSTPSMSFSGHCVSASCSSWSAARSDPDQGPLHRRPVVRLRDVRPDHRQHLRADRARLHHGLRRAAADQLRPWRLS